jgi:hypothetical protein
MAWSTIARGGSGAGKAFELTSGPSESHMVSPSKNLYLGRTKKVMAGRGGTHDKVEKKMFPSNHLKKSTQEFTGHGGQANNPHLRHGYAGYLGRQERLLSVQYKPAFDVQSGSTNCLNPNHDQQVKPLAGYTGTMGMKLRRRHQPIKPDVGPRMWAKARRHFLAVAEFTKAGADHRTNNNETNQGIASVKRAIVTAAEQPGAPEMAGALDVSNNAIVAATIMAQHRDQQRSRQGFAQNNDPTVKALERTLERKSGMGNNNAPISPIRSSSNKPAGTLRPSSSFAASRDPQQQSFKSGFRQSLSLSSSKPEGAFTTELNAVRQDDQLARSGSAFARNSRSTGLCW